MRLTVAILAVVALAIVGRFFVDDVIDSADIPRGVVVDGIPVGNTDRDTAAARLGALRADAEVTLTFADQSRTRPLADWGVTLDVDATLDAAEAMRGGGLVRFLRWNAAVLRDRTVDPIWTVDRDLLAAQFDSDDLGIVFETSTIELVDGRFEPVESQTVPLVDVDGLADALLLAVDDPAYAEIAVPSRGEDEILGDSALAAAANTLTDTELTVVLAGQLQAHTFDSATLREWLDVAGANSSGDFRFDADRVHASVAAAFPEIGDPNAPGVQFAMGFDGEPWILGGIPEAECCAADTAARLFEHLLVGPDEPIIVFPSEPEDAQGLNWAHGLGVTEVVGEFTTFYTPNQTRNINIARIAELTRGVVIEPGTTFSVNDFVGRRTRANGFVSAGVISNGVFSSSVGGGISQYATTLFNAAFFAGLDFGEYQSHSIYLDRYPYGREATVSFPAPDLQIRNTTPHAILLWPTTNADSITVRMYGTPYVVGEQTGQTSRSEGAACTRVTTERTRTWLEDGRTETDTVTARYRPEGISCSGASTRPTTTTTTTSTTVPTSVP
ncbi:MAG: VanW family protein [Acidimicrobiales bacterium]|nr:VanW family protein [Acidimicrobiales bacterium]